MSKLAPLVQRFPAQELVLRRLHSRDPDFREICEHHTAALAALHHFGAPETTSAERVEEYRRIVAELEAEIATILAENEPSGPSAVERRPPVRKGEQ
jgi:hypothetical protein